MASEASEEGNKKSSEGASPAQDEAKEAGAAAAAGEEEEEMRTPTSAVEKKRRGRKRKGEGEEEKGEGNTEKSGKRALSVERPSRERKAVERYSELSSPRRGSASKVLSVAQGSGTKLKDIPNVFYKLSKRKTDENLQALHALLFGRKSNAHFLKRNIFQFSGFVWAENEEKQRTRVKEKLDKFNKGKLVDFCEMLDIPILKSTTKKEELSAKLLEFLESPHVTRDIVLSEKEEKRKWKRRAKGISKTSGGETKKRKESSGTESKEESSSKSEEEEGEEESEEGDGGSTDAKDVSTDNKEEDDSEDESDAAENKEDEDGLEDPVASKKEASAKETSTKKGSHAKYGKSPSQPVSKNATLDAEDDSDTAIESKKELSKKQTKRGANAISKEKATSVVKDHVGKCISKSSPKKKVPVRDSDSSSPSVPKSEKSGQRKSQSSDSPAFEANKGSQKHAAESGSKVSVKGRGKGKAAASRNKGPSKDELHSVISDILKEVDFNTATLADIIKQLGAHFKMDLMDRKAEVKSIIEDVINSMSDGEDGDEDEDNDAEDSEGEDAKESDGDGDE